MSPAPVSPPPSSEAAAARKARRRARRFVLAALGGAALALLVILAYQLDRYSFHYVHTRRNPRSLEGSLPTFYYLDWSRDFPDLASIRVRLDPDGVYTSKREAAATGLERHRSVKIIQTALGLHDQLLEHPSPEVDAIFRRQLDWLRHDAVSFLPDSTPVWPENYPVRECGLRGPWVSALTQGQAISLFVRAARYTGDSTYVTWARRAARAFTRGDLPITWRGDGGEVFFEEYPCDPPVHVLNGCLLAWLGLWDYARYTGDPEVRAFCLQSMASIEATVPRYECGDWTLYHVRRPWPTSPGYQEIHASLAETLHGIFPDDPVWTEYAPRWRGAAERPWLRTGVFFRVLAAKTRMRLFASPAPAKGLMPGS